MVIGGKITTAALDVINTTNTKISLARVSSNGGNGFIDNTNDVLDMDRLGPMTIESGRIIGGVIRGDASIGNILKLEGVTSLKDLTLKTNVDVAVNERSIYFDGRIILDGAIVSLKNTNTAFHRRNGIIFRESDGILGEGEIRLEGSGKWHSFEFGTSGDLTPYSIGQGVTVRTVNGGGVFVGENPSTNPFPELTIEGTVIADRHSIEFRLFNQLTNKGRLEAIHGGELLFDPHLGLQQWANDGQIILNNGDLTITGDSLTNNVTGRIEGHGNINLNSASMTNHGTIAPDTNASTIFIDDDLTLSDTSIIEIGLVGSPSTHNSVLNIDGLLVLSGTLEIYLVDDFIPNSQDTFTILIADDIEGRFDNALERINFDNGIFDMEYTQTGVTLTNFQVPEPMTVALLCMGCLIMARRNNR